MIMDIIYQLLYATLLYNYLDNDSSSVLINNVTSVQEGNIVSHYILIECSDESILANITSDQTELLTSETTTNIAVFQSVGSEGLYLTPRGVENIYQDNSMICSTHSIKAIDSCFTLKVIRDNNSYDIIRCLMDGLKIDGYIYSNQYDLLHKSTIRPSYCSDELCVLIE